MNKVLVSIVLVLLVVAGIATYALVIRTPEKQACAHAALLCGLDPRGAEAERCTQVLVSTKRSHVQAVERASACMTEAKSCVEIAGCASGAVLGIGTGFIQDFIGGLAKTIR